MGGMQTVEQGGRELAGGSGIGAGGGRGGMDEGDRRGKEKRGGEGRGVGGSMGERERRGGVNGKE